VRSLLRSRLRKASFCIVSILLSFIGAAGSKGASWSR
jgi:hypothetical protein